MAFTYNRRSNESVQRRAEGSGRDFEGFLRSEVKLYKPRDGDNYIRFLPPTWDNADHYGLEIYVHYQVGVDEGAVLCLDKMGKDRCPVCEARVIASKQGDEDTADALRPVKRIVSYLLDMKESDRDRKPQAWAYGPTVDTMFCKAGMDRHTKEALAVDDPIKGYNLSFDRRGQGLKVKYENASFDQKSSSVPDEDLDFLLDFPLDQMLRWRDYEAVAELFEGTRRRRRDDDRRETRDRDDARGRDRDRGDDRRETRSSRDDRRDNDRRDDRERGRGRDDDDRGRSDTRREETRSDDRRDSRREDRDDRSSRESSRDEGRSERSRDRDNDREQPSNDRERGGREDRRDDDSRRESTSRTSDELKRRWANEDKKDEKEGKRGGDDDTINSRRRRTE